MRLFFRTRAEKRRANRRVARWLYTSMFLTTLLFAAVMLLAYVFGLQ